MNNKSYKVLHKADRSLLEEQDSVNQSFNEDRNMLDHFGNTQRVSINTNDTRAMDIKIKYRNQPSI